MAEYSPSTTRSDLLPPSGIARQESDRPAPYLPDGWRQVFVAGVFRESLREWLLLNDEAVLIPRAAAPHGRGNTGSHRCAKLNLLPGQWQEQCGKDKNRVPESPGCQAPSKNPLLRLSLYASTRIIGYCS